MEARIQIIVIPLIICCLKIIIWRLVPVRERESVFTTCMLWILSVPICHKLRIRRSPFWSKFSVETDEFLWVEPVGWDFPSRIERPGWIRKSLHMCKGVKYFPLRSAILSQRSLWQVVMSPSFLQPKALQIENLAFQPSQWGGRSGGSMQYRRKRALRQFLPPSLFRSPLAKKWQESPCLGSLSKSMGIQCGGCYYVLLQRYLWVLHVTAPDLPLAHPLKIIFLMLNHLHYNGILCWKNGNV